MLHIHPMGGAFYLLPHRHGVQRTFNFTSHGLLPRAKGDIGVFCIEVSSELLCHSCACNLEINLNLCDIFSTIYIIIIQTLYIVIIYQIG